MKAPETERIICVVKAGDDARRVTEGAFRVRVELRECTPGDKNAVMLEDAYDGHT